MPRTATFSIEATQYQVDVYTASELGLLGSALYFQASAVLQLMGLPASARARDYFKSSQKIARLKQQSFSSVSDVFWGAANKPDTIKPAVLDAIIAALPESKQAPTVASASV